MPPKASTSTRPPKSAHPIPAPALKKSKKRQQESDAEEEVDTLGLGTEALAFGSDEDVSGDEVDDESDGEEEDFPEVDFGASDEDQDGDFEGESDEEEEDDSEDDEEEDDDDEAALIAELEAEDALSDDDDGSSSDTGSGLSSLIRRSTTKPNESENTPGTSYEDQLGLKQDFMKRSRTVMSDITGQEKTEWEGGIDPGYGSDSSTEEATNRVGDVPAYFYDDLPHIGYDIDGKKIMRPATGDELDKFLEGVEDADGGWTTVKDKLHQKNVALTEEELDLIHRLAKSENPDAAYDPYTPTIEYFSSITMPMPLSGRPEPKSRFLPSKWEHKKVMKIVRAIRSGRIVPRRPGAPTSTVEKPPFYALWSTTDEPNAPHPMHMPAPKLALPSHSESYNPPEEYLWSKEEERDFNELEKEEKKGRIIPQKFSSLRLVPAYSNFVQERFERCLDLYLAPRMLRRRPLLNISDPSELIPKLPSPKELRPFPTTSSVVYRHPNGVKVRCVSIDPLGMWVVTGAEDGEVRLWELEVGRCAMKWKCGDGGPIYSIEWCPDREKSLFAVASASKIHLISPLPYLSPLLAFRTSSFALAGFSSASTDESGALKSHEQPADVKWSKPKGDLEREEGRLVEIDVPGTMKQIVWHKRGDYFASVAEAGNRSVLIHQLSKHQTQAPFKKQKGAVQCVAFHPSKPQFFVATQRYVRIYDLLAQQLVKTLNPGLKWISSIDVHPLGDNVIVGSYDKRLVWHDLDLSSSPYKTLRYHSRALRSVSFSPVYPLFLSTSDDGTIQIFHSTVYSDLLTNPLIVPLKVLKGHGISESLGVLQAKWHPREPWVVSVGADGDGRLWCT